MPENSEPAERPAIKLKLPSDSGSEHRRRESKELCQVCQSLDLGIHCFKVRYGSSGGSTSSRPLRSSTAIRRLGSLHGIKARSSKCPLCALIMDSVTELSPENPYSQPLDEAAESQLQRATCSISWEIDGRETAKRTGKSPRNLVRGVTRRMHIRWNHPRLSNAYLVYVAPDTFSRTTSDADRVWTKESMFLGRSLTQNIENQALIQSWLDLCRKTHRGPCQQIESDRGHRFREMVSHSYFGVIDVQNMQLTQLPFQPLTDSQQSSACYQSIENIKLEPYVALSYVWGNDTDAYKTLTENVMFHRTHGGLEEVLSRLPKAIQDAFDLVRRLGFRFVWIDRLCIVQNSPRSWKLNAYNMDLIYGNAELTICAADGDASVGLRAMRPTTRNTTQCKRHITQNLQLMVTRPPEMFIRASTWNERAWTFQERLLSRRCLIFTNGRVYYQCRSTGMSEDIFGDQKGAGWSLDLVDAPLQMFRQLDNRAIWVYMKCVELYTERKLAHLQDIQAAFSGMANMMEDRMRAPFINGLPSSHFDLALLWEPMKQAKRRIITQNSSGSSLPDFPTWSWTGWIGEVKYKDDLVAGILDNVSDWLDTHTWIKWWVRDGHGDLRPLWDADLSVEDRSKDVKWRGYTEQRAQRAEYTGDRQGVYYDEETITRIRRRDDRDFEWIRERRAENPSSESDNDDDDDSNSSPSDEDAKRSDEEGYGIYNSHRKSVSYGPNVDTGLSNGVRVIRRDGPPPGFPSTRSRSGERKRHSRVDRRVEGRDYLRYNIPSPPPHRRESSLVGELEEPLRHRERSRREYRDDYERQRRPTRRTERLESEHPTLNAAFFDLRYKDDKAEFSIALRDYPYRVVKAEYTAKPETSEFPLLPILQFRTWHTWLYIRESTPAEQQDENRRRVSMNVGLGQVRHHIVDESGDWCGSVVLDAEWAATADARQEFIAISEAKCFTLSECQEWTYYIPKERDQSEWDLFYVLLIERKDERWERVGIGKVFQEAFRSSKQREIMLS